MATLGVFRDDIYNDIGILPVAQYTASTQNGGTLAVANIVGGQETIVALSGQTTAQAITTDTALNIINTLVQTIMKTAANYQTAVANLIGVNYLLKIINNNTASGAITLTGGTGVTITGTNTIAITVSRTYLVTVTSPTTVTLQNVGSATP